MFVCLMQKNTVMFVSVMQKNTAIKSTQVDFELVSGRKNIIRKEERIYKTDGRAQIGSQQSILPRLDHLPLLDRSLVDYSKYHKYDGYSKLL